MPIDASRPADAALPESAARMIGRFFFGTSGGAAAACAVIVAAAPLPLASDIRVWLIAALVTFALLCGAAVRGSALPGFPMNLALCLVAVAEMALSALVSLAVNEGVRSPALGFCALIVCVVGAITRPRWCALLGAVAMLLLAVLAELEMSGWMTPGSVAAAPGNERPPVPVVLLFQCLVVLCAAISGGVISRVLRHFLHAASERERRFRS
ncbi:MAG: hypothetical protein ABUU24_05310, partial [Variovorax sp.]